MRSSRNMSARPRGHDFGSRYHFPRMYEAVCLAFATSGHWRSIGRLSACTTSIRASAREAIHSRSRLVPRTAANPGASQPHRYDGVSLFGGSAQKLRSSPAEPQSSFPTATNMHSAGGRSRTRCRLNKVVEVPSCFSVSAAPHKNARLILGMAPKLEELGLSIAVGVRRLRSPRFQGDQIIAKRLEYPMARSP